MSAPPVVEFVSLTASEALKASDTVGTEALNIVLESAGAQKVFRGMQAEDKATAYVAVGWDTLKAHQDLMDDKARYDPLLASLATTIAPGTQLTMVHVVFANHAAAIQALEDPAAELAWLTLKSLDQATALPGNMDSLEKALATASGRRSYTWGKVVEKEDQYLLIVGWDTVEAHLNALKVNQNLSTTVAKTSELVEIDLVHVNFTEYKL